jgi:PAS domain S-box-containing protein
MSTLQQLIRTNILDSMPTGLMVIGGEGQVHVVNTALCEILGYSREHFMGSESCCSVLFLDDPGNDAFNDIILRVVQNEEVNHRRRVWYVRPDREKRYLEIITSFLRDGSENWGLVLLIQDLSDLQLMHDREKAALQKSNQLERQKAESLNNLALSIAHQIRNPVMTIGGFAKLCLSHLDDPDKTSKYLESVLESAQRLENMAGAVGLYASIKQPTIRKVDLPPLVQSAWDRARERVALPDHTVHLDQNLALQHPLFADPEQLGTVLELILENALEASREINDDPKTVTIEARDDAQESVLTITDQGPGIPEDILPYVRDPFFTTKAVGAGMGLAIAQHLVAGHDGMLEIACPGPGTSVTIRLPRHTD